MTLSGYRVIDNYDNEVEMADEDRKEGSKEYNLFRVLLFYIIIGFLGWNIFYFVFTSSWFDIKKVTINGNNYLDSETILAQSELNEPVNIFHFDIERATKKLSHNPWVKDVTMKKIYPKQLNIKIEERKPGALLYSNNLYYLVTAEGVILTTFDQFNSDFKQYIITGLDVGSRKPGEMIEDQAYKETQRIIHGLNNLFPDQFYKIEIISEEEYLLFHNNNKIKVRIENGEQLINEWYLLESALQKVAAEQIPLQEINMKYKERLLIILKD
ncbi:MAG: FtsQ-type POTRA domain-containing protein [Atribacterota bacterium]|nr:FtsQ-type POTRA domain-containing protein [Atribacterota bacterium]